MTNGPCPIIKNNGAVFPPSVVQITISPLTLIFLQVLLSSSRDKSLPCNNSATRHGLTVFLLGYARRRQLFVHASLSCRRYPPIPGCLTIRPFHLPSTHITVESCSLLRRSVMSLFRRQLMISHPGINTMPSVHHIPLRSNYVSIPWPTRLSLVLVSFIMHCVWLDLQTCLRIILHDNANTVLRLLCAARGDKRCRR